MWKRSAGAALVGEFRAAEKTAGSGPAFDAWCLQWNQALARRVTHMPCVGGMHVMPLNVKARGMVVAMLASGDLPRGM